MKYLLLMMISATVFVAHAGPKEDFETANYSTEAKDRVLKEISIVENILATQNLKPSEFEITNGEVKPGNRKVSSFKVFYASSSTRVCRITLGFSEDSYSYSILSDSINDLICLGQDKRPEPKPTNPSYYIKKDQNGCTGDQEYSHRRRRCEVPYQYPF